MNRLLLLDAVRGLETFPETASYARIQAVRQFNALLEVGKSLYPTRVDIQAIEPYPDGPLTGGYELNDAVRRLRSALELRPPGSLEETLAQILLPAGAPADLELDLEELKAAVGTGLKKTPLLLAGSITEALLLSRHSDTSDRGPGLHHLVEEARRARLFGRDTLRQLDTLIDYRDLIHARAQTRNGILPNEARVSMAVNALKLLCAELEDPDVRYNS